MSRRTPPHAAQAARQAVPQAQPFPDTLFRQAVAWHQAGGLPDAEHAYRAVLAASPRHAPTMTLLATLLAQTDRPEEAVRLFDASLKLDRDQELALFNRGNLLFALQRHADALASYNRAVALWPGHAPLLNNRGNALLALGRKLEALAGFDRAIAADPHFADAHFNRANVLQLLGRPAEALASLDRAIAEHPDYPDAHYNRGTLLHALDRDAEALESLDRAVALAPDDARAAFNRAIVLQVLGQYEAALAGYDRAIALSPGHADAWHARSWPLELLGRREEALASVEQAIALVPDHALAQRAKALLLLRRGDYAEGWRLAEWRWACPDAPPRRPFAQRLWLGEEDVAGKTVLLHAEQGFGDSLQCCRYAPLVAARGARVVLEVPRALVPAMARLDGVAQLVAEGDALPRFDLHCPLMSLPLALRTELHSVPRAVPYLRAAPDRLERWAVRLGPATRPRVGLAWAGNPNNPIDRIRSVALQALLPLVGCGAALISLQKVMPPADRAVLEATPDLMPLGAELDDFGDTAAVIELLDVVVAVDTAVAHLAGALGKPLWMMLSPAADWRWLVGEADAPWYPTARLFRWDAARGWAGVVADVRAALAALCGD